ncbi:MAG: O-antigen ligase family protein [Acidobacteriia bacterium]|nr:O-antigen ligase family protein [Terriglobia bacterium]
MIKLRHILIGILVYAVSTVWVRERWAIAGLEASVFLCAGAVFLGAAWRKEHLTFGIPPLLLAGVCSWGVLQLVFRWTVVEADTAGAVLYWLAAACLAWLGHRACAVREERQKFLRDALAAGAAVCLLGVVQLFTSDGRVFWLFPSGYDSLVIGPFVYRNNFAAFVELLLPVALVLAFRDRRHSVAYLAVAAALVASVVASGSRAGTLAVIAESALVFLLKPPAQDAGGQRVWARFAVLAAAFTLIVGYQYFWQRFSEDQDPYNIRREFVASSLAMVRAQPLHGFGFGTWPSAYKPFAIIDTGMVANHAHNEWAQWAAEGGLPALALMLALLGCCLPAAVRSIWGLGVIAVFLHSVVDYPFMRLGLAAWIFVFIGALAGYAGERRQLSRPGSRRRYLPAPLLRALAAAGVPVLALGVYQSVKVAWADALYRRATPAGIARAAGLCPDQAEYQVALAQTDSDQSVGPLRRALALNPFLTSARIALASELESRGDLAGSEAALLEAARRDRQYAPAWALANFYFRNDRSAQFWQWARNAAWISYGGLSPLFDLCFASTDDAQAVMDRVVVPRRIVEREYMAYLAGRGRLTDARAPALRIAASADSDGREALLNYVDRALESGHLEEALLIWKELCKRRLVPYAAAAQGLLVNGDFRQTISNRAFDWHLAPNDCGQGVQTHEENPALEVAFSGQQPESCEVLSHFAPLAIGGKYVLRFQYLTADLPKRTGLRWSVGEGPECEISSSEDWKDGTWRFQATGHVTRLVLAYRRDLGTTRTEGTIQLRQIRLEEDKNL